MASNWIRGPLITVATSPGRFSLSKVQELLGLDDKSLRKYLQRLDIKPERDLLDHRLRVLTIEQVTALGNELAIHNHTSDEPRRELSPAGLESLMDRIKRVETLLEALHSDLAALRQEGPSLTATQTETITKLEHSLDVRMDAFESKLSNLVDTLVSNLQDPARAPEPAGTGR